MTKHPQHNRAVALMIAVTLLWSIAGVVSRQLQSAASLEVTFWRSGITFVFVALALLWQQGASSLMRSLRSHALWLSGLCWCVMFTAFMVAIMKTTVANVLITMSIAPVFTLILSRVWLGYRISLFTTAIILIAVSAMISMFMGDASIASGTHALGLVIALCVPIASAVNWNLTNKSGAHVDLLPAVMIGALLSALLTLPFAMPFQATAADIAWLSLLGVFQLGVPCLIAVWCAQRLPAPELSLLCLLEVIFGVLWAWLGAGEQPSQRVLMGGTLVLAALAVNELRAMKQSQA